MPETTCGWNNVPGAASGSDLLVAWGPTLIVDIGFDPNYNPNATPLQPPVAGVKGMNALVDTGGE